jgi:hypothetical protein
MCASFAASMIAPQNPQSNGATMAIVVVFRFPHDDVSKYNGVFEAGGDAILAQPKRLSHLCFEDGAGFTVVDVWEDEASFAAFGPVIGPTLAEVGLSGEPEIHRVIGTISQDGARTSY